MSACCCLYCLITVLLSTSFHVCMYTLGFNNEILIILVVVINRKRLSLKKCYKYHKLL